jgi:hypothetical protein
MLRSKNSLQAKIAHTPDKTNYKPRFLTDKLFKNEMSSTLRMVGTLNDEY